MTRTGLTQQLDPQVVRPFITWSPTLKVIMAISGAVWLGFLVGHLGTNIRVFAGADVINSHYAGIKSNPLLFWGVRVVLALSIIAHSTAAFLLTRRSHAARPVGYEKRAPMASTLASRSMKWSGPLVGVFIIYHLLHLTGGQAMPPGTSFASDNQYANIVSSLSLWPVALVYVVSLVLLSVHLWHGATAALLSVGFRHPRHTAGVQRAALLLVALIIGGMLSIPIGVLLGWA